eukprot:SM000057S18352  [mRNA]  locus=s57:139526:141933:- [translate_table: standard]
MAAGSLDAFPAGLRVLVVDDDILCLTILDRMLRACSYHATTCSNPMVALKMLRENKDKFDLVISDVNMPQMDGFKLLELIGLELDLPVIMMSSYGETNVVMKGITHGACDYLIKPVRVEELRNIWQHVVRKKTREIQRDDVLGHGEWDESRLPDSQEQELTSSTRKRKPEGESAEERFAEELLEEPNGLKKPRVVWSVELHQQFVNAVNDLGIEKAVPKRILEIMNVTGLTRENVASHLQKYRLYLKRLSGVQPQPHPVASFQASREGEKGGVMQIQPGGRGSQAAVQTKSSANLGSGTGSPATLQPAAKRTNYGRPSVGEIDSRTLATLAQLQQLQRLDGMPVQPTMLTGLDGITTASKGNVLGGGGDGSSGTLSQLQALSPYDLNMLMQAQQEQSQRQRLAAAAGTDVLGEAVPGMDQLMGVPSSHPLPGSLGTAASSDGLGEGTSGNFGDLSQAEAYLINQPGSVDLSGAHAQSSMLFNHYMSSQQSNSAARAKYEANTTRYDT